VKKYLTKDSSGPAIIDLILGPAHTPALSVRVLGFFQALRDLVQDPDTYIDASSATSKRAGACSPEVDLHTRVAAYNAAHISLTQELDSMRKSVGTSGARDEAGRALAQHEVDETSTVLDVVRGILLHWQVTGEKLRDLTSLAFSKCNADRHDPGEELYLWVDAKNVGPALMVSVYDIDLEAWHRESSAPVATDIDLSGVGATCEQEVPLGHGGRGEPDPFVARRVRIEVPGVGRKRGCVMVDVAGGGRVCRCDREILHAIFSC
jgi:hypothetical protein